MEKKQNKGGNNQYGWKLNDRELKNYHLSQKFKLFGNAEFNHLAITNTLPLDKWAVTLLIEN